MITILQYLVFNDLMLQRTKFILIAQIQYRKNIFMCLVQFFIFLKENWIQIQSLILYYIQIKKHLIKSLVAHEKFDNGGRYCLSSRCVVAGPDYI